MISLTKHSKLLYYLKTLVVNNINVTEIRPIFRVFSYRTTTLWVRKVLGGNEGALGLENEYVALTRKWTEV